jgi:phage gpG-like protein
VTNDDQIKQFRKHITDMLPDRTLDRGVFLEIGHIFLAEMQENFRVGGRPSPWPESTRVRRLGGQTLLKSGALLRSLSVSADRESSTIGSNKIYARIHALGGIIRAKNAEYLMFRVPAGIRKTDGRGRILKKPQTMYSWVRVKQVTIPQRDYTFISESGFNRALAVIERHMRTVN